MSVLVSLRLPDEQAKALDELSKESGRSKTYLISKALELYLEDVADGQVALDRLRDKNDPIISSADIR